jgi:hypothetical protein
MSRGLVVFAGLLAATSASATDPAQQELPKQKDPRLVRLQQYFHDKASPAHALAADFIAAADRHHLDWRLLPSISMVESGGGKNYRNNNIMGWNSSRTRFKSIRSGIDAVASRFANSQLYKGKSLLALLKVYNPRVVYTQRVLAVMEAIGPAEFQLATN